MKAQRLLIPEALVFLWLYLKGCYCSLEEGNQVCVEKNFNSSAPPDCYEYAWANFGDVIQTDYIKGVLVLAEPRTACSSIKAQSSYNSSGYSHGKWFLLIDAADCEFDSKAARATEGGFDAAIIWNTKNYIEPIAWHSESERRKVTIPVIYIAKDTGDILEEYDFERHRESRVLITAQDYPPVWDYGFYMIPFAIIVGICFILMAMFMISRYYRHYLEQRRNRLSPTNLKKIPTKKFKKDDDYYDVCAICLEEYKEGERLRILPCDHAYHCKCVDPWLTEGKRTCPVCKRPVLNDKRSRNRARRTDVEAHSVEIAQDPDETTPLIASTSASVASSSMAV